MPRGRKKRQWKDLSVTQRIVTVLLGMLQLALLAAALIDLRQRTEDEVNGSKSMWTGIVFINYVGPIAYFLLGRNVDPQGSAPQEFQI